MGGLLRTRNFALFWSGETISGFGSAITTVLLPLVAVTTLHASALMVTLVTAADWLPWLLIGLPAGTWVDRWPRRRVLVVADLTSAAVMLALPLASWAGVLSVGTLLVGVLVAGTSTVFFTLAVNAYLPHLVTPGDRLEGNSKLQTSATTAQIAGPGLGGILAQSVSAVSGLLLDALTFGVSAACLLSLRTTPEPRPTTADRPGMIDQLREGVVYFRREGFMLPMLAVAASMNVAMLGVFALRILFLVRTEGASAATVGVLISLGSLGGLLGAVCAAPCVRRFGSARTYLVTTILTAPFMLLLPASGAGWWLASFAIGSFVVTAGATMAGVITVTFRSNYVPPHLLGRVTALTRFVVSGTIPLGATAAGLLATLAGVHPALWAFAALFALTPLPLLATSVRTMRDFPVISDPQ